MGGQPSRALVAAIERAAARRYSTFWASRTALAESAQRLAELLAAVVVPIADADQLFTDLRDRVIALERVNAEHPISGPIAAERIKELLTEGDDIRLHDYVQREVEALRARLEGVGGGEVSAENVTRVVEQIEAQCNLVLRIVSVLAFWGDCDDAVQLLLRGLPRLATVGGNESVWSRLRRYAAFLAMYAIGVAAISGGNDKALVRLVQHRFGSGRNGTDRRITTMAAFVAPLPS